jgi:hypothetical protein
MAVSRSDPGLFMHDDRWPWDLGICMHSNIWKLSRAWASEWGTSLKFLQLTPHAYYTNGSPHYLIMLFPLSPRL